MKIKKFQSGGISYIPTDYSRGAADTSAASSSKVPGFTDKIIDMVLSEGIDSDVNSFLSQVEQVLNLANDPTGQNLSMREILQLARAASSVKTNYLMFKDAQKALDSEDAWGDIATDSRGYIYTWNQKSNKIEKVTPSKYDPQEQIALTNQDLLNIRWNNVDTRYDTSIITDVTKTIGMKTISNYLVDLIKKFEQSEVTGYASKTNSDISSGLKALVNHIDTNGNTIGDLITAGPDGLYKLSQKATVKDTNIAKAVAYLIQSLSNDMKHALVAKATVEGYTPDAYLVELLDIYTGRSMVADYDANTSRAANGGGEGGSSGSKIQQTLAESYVTGSNVVPMQMIPIAPNNSKTTLFAPAQNVQSIRLDRSGQPGQPMPISNLRTVIQDAYALGNVTNRGTVVFGDQLISDTQLNGLVYTGTDMYRVILPFKVVDGRHIVPDFELQNKLNDIVENGKNQGNDISTINRYLNQACPGARYNPETQTIELPNDRKHAFLTFGAQAASNYVDFNTDSDYITKVSNPNTDVYKNAVQYGYATHDKNDEKSTEASGIGPAIDPLGWRTSGKIYEGMVYLPISNDLAGTLGYNQGYTDKDLYTNVSGRYEEHEREMAIQDRMNSGGLPTNW